MSSLTPRVLHIHFGKDGGAERFFVNLVQALGERGVEQRFVVRPGRTWRGEIEGLGPLVENHYRRLSISSLLLEWRLGRIAHRWRPNAIVAWMPRAARLLPDYPEAVKLARLGDYPKPKHLRHFSRADILIGNHPGIVRRCRDLGWTRPVRTVTNFPCVVPPRPVARAALDTPEDVLLISRCRPICPQKGDRSADSRGCQDSGGLALAHGRRAGTIGSGGVGA